MVASSADYLATPKYSADWNTPACVVERVRAVAEIALDPCSNADSIVGAQLDIDHGGLEYDWREGGGLVYVNPPYGRGIGPWIEKCVAEAARGCEVIALLPARTDTGWFQPLWDADALCFWRGRLTFVGAPSAAPFPSVVAYWGNRWRAFAKAFDDAGAVVRP